MNITKLSPCYQMVNVTAGHTVNHYQNSCGYQRVNVTPTTKTSFTPRPDMCTSGHTKGAKKTSLRLAAQAWVGSNLWGSAIFGAQ